MLQISPLQQTVLQRLNLLSPEKLQLVLNFIEFIINYSTKPKLVPAANGFVQYAGSWQFEPNELAEILQDIETSRQMELAEQ